MYHHTQRKPSALATLFRIGAGLAVSGTALAGECWVDIYDKANFEGSRARIEGPKELADLKNVNQEDWSNRIESLEVGADAEVLAFRKPDFEDKPQGSVYHQDAFKSWGNEEIPAYQEWDISFGPGKKEHHLGELHFHKNINSLKIRCRQ